MTRRANLRAMVAGGALCMMVGLALLLPSCDVSSHALTSGPRRGGRIVVAREGEVGSLLPGQADSGENSVTTAQVIWAPLWYRDAGGKLAPGLAREIPSLANDGLSLDLKTWTIRLRPGLRWSDGSPLTAADVAFSLNTYANPHFGSCCFPLHDPHDPIDFLGATALDPTTVRFTIAHPNITMLAWLEDGFQAPIPQAVYGSMKPGDIPKSRQDFLPTVVSGPFMPTEHVQGDHLTVVRNPYYYQGPDKPYLDQITFKILPNQSAMLHAVQAGLIDAAYNLSFANLDGYRAVPGYTAYLDRYLSSGYEMLVFNLTNPILKDLVVRQALAMSLDPRQLIAHAMHGAAIPDCDDSVGTFAHEPELACYVQDPARAAELLDQDGWRLGADGYRHKGGQRLELRYSTTNAPQRLTTEALAQADWEAIGIKLDIQNQQAYQFFGPTLTNGTFDIAEFFNDPSSYDPDDHWFLMCNQTTDHGGANFGHYCNSAVDQLEVAQQVTADTSTRLAEFHRIHLAVLADLPVMYLYIPRLLGVYRDTLHNYMPAGLYFEMWNVWDWYLSST